MLSGKEMGSVGAAVVRRTDPLLLILFSLLCILSALRLEFVACNVGKKVHLWWRVGILIDMSYRVLCTKSSPSSVVQPHDYTFEDQ
jgi:hypothetical protein